MATVKIKFRPSSVDGREGTVYYQVIHGRVARQINTSYKLFPAEWDKRHSRIVIISPDKDRQQYLLSLDKKITEDIDRLENVITVLERKGGAFTADGVTSAFHGEHRGLFFLVFMREVINGLKYLGKVRTRSNRQHPYPGYEYTRPLRSWPRLPYEYYSVPNYNNTISIRQPTEQPTRYGPPSRSGSCSRSIQPSYQPYRSTRRTGYLPLSTISR